MISKNTLNLALSRKCESLRVDLKKDRYFSVTKIYFLNLIRLDHKIGDKMF